MNKLATILLCVNFIMVLFPQPGYIHPDEFFQSVEIVAGDVLDVTHFRAWEFDEKFPVRSIVFPYILTAPPLYLLGVMDSSRWHGLHISTVKVVMSTRLPMAFLSVFGYLATGKLADTFGVDRYLSTVFFCSSYVTWTYYTRTFSNSIESVLLAILLLIALPYSGDSTQTKGEVKSTESKKNKESEGSQDDGKEDKNKCNTNEQQQNRLKGGNVNGWSYLIGMIVAAGSFNRPTFAVFAVIPLAMWLSKRGSGLKSGRFKRFICDCLGISYGIVTTTIVFVFLDTVYYKPSFIKDMKAFLHLIISGEMSFELMVEQVVDLISKLEVTPLNFVLYNTDPTNLAKHGLHPHILHFFINLPLLIGPVYVPFLFISSLALFKVFFGSQSNSTERGSQIKQPSINWLSLMALVPVLALSVFPHQEPRFLIPVLPILMVMGAKVVSAMTPAKMSFITLWAFFNILMTIGYGYLHQGAIVPAMSIYQQKLASVFSQLEPVTSQHTAIFYKTYPPPQHLLILPTWTSKYVHIVDLAGAPVSDLQAAVYDSRAKCKGSQARKGSCHTYLFMPATVAPWVTERLTTNHKLQVTSICPHLSMEAAPRLMAWWRGKISLDEFLMEFCLQIVKIT